MTTSAFTTNYSVSTAAYFRAWALAIHDALIAVGMVQTADTGQLDLVTAPAPSVANAEVGYRTYRFADSLQATRPIFIRLGFGAQSNTTMASSLPAMFLTVGKATDGAGNVSGILLAAKQLGAGGGSSSATGSTASFTGIVSGGDGRLAVLPWLSVNSGANGVGLNGYRASFFMIERTNDGDGLVICSPAYTATTAGAPMSSNSTTTLFTAPTVDAINYETGQASEYVTPVILPSSVAGVAMGATASLAAGSIGPVFPWVIICPGLAPYQCVSMMTFPGGDAPGSTFTTTLGGVSRTYYPVPLSDAHNCFGLTVGRSISSGANLLGRYAGVAVEWD